MRRNSTSAACGDLVRLHGEEPREVRDAEVASHQFRADRDERGERPLALIVVVWLVVLGAQIEDEMLPRDLRAHRLADEVRAQRLRVDALRGDTKHQPVRPPVREVHVRVEVALDELRGVGLQIAPLVLVPEARRCNLGPCRGRAKGRHLLRRKGSIKRDELVALVLAHRTWRP
jgi:hypothetical protein